MKSLCSSFFTFFFLFHLSRKLSGIFTKDNVIFIFFLIFFSKFDSRQWYCIKFSTHVISAYYNSFVDGYVLCILVKNLPLFFFYFFFSVFKIKINTFFWKELLINNIILKDLICDNLIFFSMKHNEELFLFCIYHYTCIFKHVQLYVNLC